jgi:sigma-B regulation protein RsbU (phosphoserine phosphatase)
LIRTYAVDHHRYPERLLRVTNQRILADMSTGLFVTLFYGVLDPASGILTYCNAGHPPPYIIQHGEDEVVEALRNTGMPLGVSNETEWQTMTAVVPPGAVLLLYTDGLLDAQNQDGIFFGEGQVLDIMRSQIGHPVQVIQDELLARVYAFAGSGPQGDDITLMTLIREH